MSLPELLVQRPRPSGPNGGVLQGLNNKNSSRHGELLSKPSPNSSRDTVNEGVPGVDLGTLVGTHHSMSFSQPVFQSPKQSTTAIYISM